MSNKTAILFFSRSAAAEARQKYLLAPKKSNKKVFAAFIVHAKQTLKKTGLPYFIYDEQQQAGNSFGEKLSGGIQSVFLKGFTNVIVTGNDCLQLDAAAIISADKHLKSNDLVFGPSHNGGVYLIGITKAAFIATDFKKINWQTSSVFEELKNIAARFSYKCLTVLSEINIKKDLTAVKKYLSRFYRLTEFITSILASLSNKENKFIYSSIVCYSFFCNSIRPPPPGI